MLRLINRLILVGRQRRHTERMNLRGDQSLQEGIYPAVARHGIQPLKGGGYNDKLEMPTPGRRSGMTGMPVAIVFQG